MPIQFRCYFCDMALGIASRKAGQVVTCPRCQGQVYVPDLPRPEPVETTAPASVEPPGVDVELVAIEQPLAAYAPTVFTPMQIVLLLVILLAVLIVLFEVGLWVGRFWRPA